MKKIKVQLPEKTYDICIEAGLINKIPSYMEKVSKGHKIVLITDYSVQDIYGHALKKQLIDHGFKVKSIVIPVGESSKSMPMLETIYEELLDFHMTREDFIISLGGGVVGDLAGFAAATYLRGIGFIQIPTSLLAQIDSSIGGKVAINLPRGKNLVGSFYQPQAVFIDPNVLATLDKRNFYDGMAEVIKYACILDRNLFEKLMEYSRQDLIESIEEIIYTCCNIKRELVEQDEKDRGKRMLLNFGHTLGHAIEKYFYYEKHTHGEAVAMGMYGITQRTETLGMTKKGTTEQLEKILEKYHLNYKMPKMDLEEIIKIITLDKKNKGDYIYTIVLREIGAAEITKLNLTDFKSKILR